MRRFAPTYLDTTRRGMWADSRRELADLRLETCDAVLDVGCGTGAFTRVLRKETDGRVVGLDRDPDLLAHLEPPTIRGNALGLPVRADGVDAVACQALLVNLPDPVAAVREFARAAARRVGAVEPDNGAVRVESTVPEESSLSRRARELYLDGVETDATLGADAASVFEAAGLSGIRTRRYDHERVIEAPYSEEAVEAVSRKASGAGLERDRETLLAATSAEAVDDLRQRWRAMGRAAAAQMADGEYRRREVVPFHVTVGEV